MGMILKENNRLKIGNENPESLAAVHTKKRCSKKEKIKYKIRDKPP